jgi:hypothetical protein
LTTVLVLGGCPKQNADDGAQADSSAQPACAAAADAASASAEETTEEGSVIAETEVIKGPRGYRFTLAQDGSSYVFTLVLTNTGNITLDHTYSSGETHEFRVLRDGELLWSSSEGLRFTQAFHTEQLPPASTLSFSAQWNGMSSAGQDLAREQVSIEAVHKVYENHVALRIVDIGLM